MKGLELFSGGVVTAWVHNRLEGETMGDKEVIIVTLGCVREHEMR